MEKTRELPKKRLDALARRYAGMNSFADFCAMRHDPLIRGNNRALLLVRAFNHFQASKGLDYRAAYYYEYEDLKAQAAALNWPI